METGKRVLAVISVLWFILLPGFARMEPDELIPVGDLDELVEILNNNAKSILTIQSGFIQKKQLEFLDETLVSKGRFWFRKESSLRWAYEEPYSYAIIIHQGKFQIKDGEKVSAYDIESNAAFREINDLIIRMVQGNIMDQDKFEMEAFENNHRYLVKLVPLDQQMKEVISDMEIIFNKTDLTVSEIIMKESESDYTVITFIDKQINEPIPDPVFTTDY